MLFLDPTDHLVEYWFKLLYANYNGVIIVESCLSKFSETTSKYVYGLYERATRVVIHSIFILGPLALSMGENYL